MEFSILFKIVILSYMYSGTLPLSHLFVMAKLPYLLF